VIALADVLNEFGPSLIGSSDYSGVQVARAKSAGLKSGR